MENAENDFTSAIEINSKNSELFFNLGMVKMKLNNNELQEAANLGAGHISGAIAVPESSDEFTVKTNVFSGKAIAYVSVHSEKKVISVLPNSIPPKEDKVQTSIVEFNEELGEGKIKVTKLKPLGDGIPLPEAELVVSAGRGLKGPENWGIVEDLAKSLGATTACSMFSFQNQRLS